MKKGIKILGVTILVILALMLVVPMALSGKIGDIVKREANAMLNAQVDFEKLDISLFRHFPNASLELVDFSVTGIAPFEGERLVAAKRVEVAVDLFSIFGESFEVGKVWLVAPELYGRVLADGSVNWDIMKPSEEGAEEGAAEPESTEEADGESSLRLSLRSLKIRDAKIYYTDEQSNLHFHTAPLNLSLSGDLSAAETTLALSADAADITLRSGDMTLASGIRAVLDGAVAANLATERYALQQMRLGVNNVTAALNGWVQMEGEDIVTDITLDCSDNNFRDILSLVPAFYTKDFENLTASGNVSLTGAVKGRLSGDNYPAFDLALNVADGSFKYADLPKSVSDIVLALALHNPGGDLDATTLNISRFGAAFAGNTVGATLKASTPMSDLAFAASVDGRLDLGSIKEVYPLEDISLAGIISADMSASGRMSHIDKGAYDKIQTAGRLGVEGMNVNYGSLPPIAIERAVATVNPSRLALESLDVKIGESDLSANGLLSNYWGWLLRDDTLSGTLNVRSSLIDANALMAGLTDEEEPAAEQGAEPKSEDTEAEQASEAPASVIEVPKNLSLLLNSRFDKVLFEKMVIENLRGAISMRGGCLSLDNLTMRLFDGTATASASYSTEDVTSPAVALDAKFSEASFKRTFEQLEMMQSIAPVFEKIEGTYTMSLVANMRLDEQMSPVLGSINGKGQIRSGHFSLSNVAAVDALAKVVGGGTLDKFQTSEPTLVSFTIVDGNVVTKPFDVKVGKTKLTLSGLTGLDSRIDYNVEVALPNNLTLAGKIGGTFTSPKVTLDAAKTVEAALANAGITKQSVGEELQKQADALIAEAEKAGAKLVAAAQAESDKLVAKSSNPIAKAAAQVAGKKLVQEAEKQSQRLIDEARRKAAELLQQKQ
ncbi:MAG: AsmA family protein [Alistipes sp.]|nr:AsmA family protein [Alistipes sp.]